MGLMDILQHYAQPASQSSPDAAQAHYDEVSKSAPPEVLGQGLGDAFRADHTPPFGQMVGQLFGQSNPQQRAGVINQLLGAIGPGVLASLGGGMLARMTGQSNSAAPQLTPQQAADVTPQQVQEIATHAQQNDPSVVDKIGGIYAQHPQLVKTLGSAALAVVLAGVANRMRN